MNRKIKEVDAYQAYERIQHGAILIDIREKEEVETVSFDMKQQMLIPQSEIILRLREIPRDREVIIGCNSGTRSYHITRFLTEQNFENVYNLLGGITKWIELNLPVRWNNIERESNIEDKVKVHVI